MDLLAVLTNCFDLNRIYFCNKVGIALGYVLDDWRSSVRFLAGAESFSLHHRVQNGSGAYQPAIQ
jgi:hypothetical protein